ncbi:histamine N-methyltransferase-like [Betta splendens]|uniref:Histamine N-methyltransferase-like n=1 Tax=Betta splendens TaxID=158456 RepID=A0A6P7LIX2_BETSP|nr:histamine N-methyltransferase-like [Betta splendens]
MAAEARQTCYEGNDVQSFQFFLKHSGEHGAIQKDLQRFLPGELKRIGEGKSSMDVLGVGSGGGEHDVQILSLLQSAFPTAPLTADVVEGSRELTDNFKALVAKTPSLQTVPFAWHISRSEDYQKQVEKNEVIKKFDLIHLIQMLYFVDDIRETIKFYHSLLKTNGKILIIQEKANGGHDILWKTFKNDLCNDAVSEYRSSGEVVAQLKSLGLKYEEHEIPHTFDITDCFDPNSANGKFLLNYMTAREDFHQSLSPEVRAAIFDLLRNKCSTEKDGKVLFNGDLSCILVHA